MRRRRVDLKAILADEDLRRDLMVSTIQATQAREGIETSKEQADRAYYVVNEADKATFFDLERFRGGKRSEPDRREEMFVRALTNEFGQTRFDVARRDFSAIDGTPLAFRRVGLVAHVFRDCPPLEPGTARARVGGYTGNDEQFIRMWWEPLSANEDSAFTWEPYAKGGGFSRFYSDVYLAIHWDPQRKTYANFYGRAGRPSHLPDSVEDYFKPGLTWPRRTQRGLNIRYLASGCVFSNKGPVLLPNSEESTWYLLALSNSAAADYLLRALMSFGSWEAGVLRRLPIPETNPGREKTVGELARAIHDSKASWDEGNEISTRFKHPWLLTGNLDALEIPEHLDHLTGHESAEESRIQNLYTELNDEVYKLYGIPDATRAVIEETLGERPPEILWPQMEGKTTEQKRMEHLWRLLSYTVKLVVEADEDGIVPFAQVGSEPSLLDRVRAQLERLFPNLDSAQVETDIVNELKNKVKGYRRANSLGEWLDNVYFDYHTSLYKSRPIFWHIASNQGTSPFAFGALVHYHKFDRNRIAKLRAQYLRETIDTCRREAALAEKDGRVDDRLEWQSRLEETQDLDHRLQWVQEGHHEGPEGGDHDYRILTPWKTPDERPKGWDPDIDDGVKVNIEPLQKAGVLRIAKVV